MTTFWRAVFEGVYVHAFEPFGVNSYAIAGPGGLVVVDSGNNLAQGQTLYDESVQLAQQLGIGQVLALVNTHAHFDHCFGNFAFTRMGVPLVTHAGFSAHVGDYAVGELTNYHAGTLPYGIQPGLWDDVVLTVPDIVIASSMPAHLIPPLQQWGVAATFVALAPAHTTADLLLHLENHNLWITGDIVEESGPLNIEPDTSITGWHTALAKLFQENSSSTLFLPGHGNPRHKQILVQHMAQLSNQ